MGGSSCSGDVPAGFVVTPSMSASIFTPTNNGDGTYSVTVVATDTCGYCDDILGNTYTFKYESAYDYPSFSGTILSCSFFDYLNVNYTFKVYQLTYTKS